jgi:hypothetical protein
VVTDILNEAWEWFKEKVVEIVGTVVNAVLLFVDKVDEALETLWKKLAKPILDTVFPIIWRIFSFPGDVLEFIFGKVFDLFRFLYGQVSVLVHEVEVKIFDITVSAVRMVYDVVTSMFVNVYNAVRSLYAGVRDVTAGFILGTVRRVRERLHTIITVDLWILGCYKAFQGSLESFSFGDFLKSAVLCLLAPVASGYIAGIITSLTPTPGTEFPGFIPSLEFPELRVEDLPRFSVVAPPPVSFPTVGVSTLPFVAVMDLGVRYEVVGVVVVGYVLSDSVSVELSDVWGYGVGRVLSLSDDVGLSLVDSWVGGYVYSVDDSVGLGLSDSWVVWMDEIQLISFAGVGVSYPAIVDVNDIVVSAIAGGVSYPAVVDVNDIVVSAIAGGVSYPAVVDVNDIVVSAIAGGVSYPAIVDVVDLVVSTVSGGVSYPAIVDVIDLIVGAGVSVG